MRRHRRLCSRPMPPPLRWLLGTLRRRAPRRRPARRPSSGSMPSAQQPQQLAPCRARDRHRQQQGWRREGTHERLQRRRQLGALSMLQTAALSTATSARPRWPASPPLPRQVCLQPAAALWRPWLPFSAIVGLGCRAAASHPPPRLTATALAACHVATSVQVLRIFKVPCEAGKLKEAYRVAVRMYHPDSNSKDKVRGGWLEERMAGGRGGTERWRRVGGTCALEVACLRTQTHR